MLDTKWVWMSLVLSVLGLLVAGSVLFSFLNHHWGRLKIQERMGPFLLVLFSLLWPALTLPWYINIILTGKSDDVWCQYLGITVICAVGGALSGHVLLALERYYMVLKSQKLTTAKIITCFCIIYGYQTVALVIRLVTAPDGFILNESGLWCFLDMASSHPTHRANNILAVLYCVGAVCFISYAYFSVFYRTREVANMRKKPSAHRTMTALEKRVFYRCLLITASFIITYSPTFLGLFYRFFTGYYISPVLDYATATWSLLDNIITPVLVCYMQSDFRDAVLAQLPEKWRLYLQEYFKKAAIAVRSGGAKSSSSRTGPSADKVPQTQIQSTECLSQE